MSPAKAHGKSQTHNIHRVFGRERKTMFHPGYLVLDGFGLGSKGDKTMINKSPSPMTTNHQGFTIED
jgi:hypothetical protein